MGTTRIKVIDLSSDQKEIKTSRKHAEKLTGAAKIREEEKPKAQKESAKPDEKIEKGITEVTEKEQESTAIESPTAPSGPSKPAAPSVITKPSAVARKKHHRGKKYQEAAKLIDKSRNYPAREALELLTKTSLTRFDPTVEVHLNVSDKNIRTKVNFPHPIGAKREKKFLVFSSKRTDAKNVIWGNETSIAEIESGKLKPGRDFDTVITTPGFMPQLAKVAKILGPKGMMPNPKNGTIQEDPTKALNQSDDSYEFKTDPTTPIVHTKIGKLSDKPEALEENLKALIGAVGPTKIRKAVIKTTMSPAVRLDVATIAHLA